MDQSTASTHIREINRESRSEIELVAERMRQTLIEVMGEERGTSFYSTEWLVERVLWHLNPERIAKIFLAENATKEITAHAIARIEKDENENSYGYFSTVYVDPRFRNKGLASLLIRHVEAWLRELKMPKIVYNTAKDHSKLIRLFEGLGYQITEQEGEMVRLTKPLK